MGRSVRGIVVCRRKEKAMTDDKRIEENKDAVERRCAPMSLRAAADGEESRGVEGYAALFGVESDRLPFVETIARGAFDGVVEQSDVLCLVNHDEWRGLLARSTNGKGSLKLEVDDKGLRYSFEAPKTSLGDELLENLRRGDVTESSFAFTVKEDTWENVGTDEKPQWRRTITKIGKLYDVSPVYTAAYSATSVNTRGRDKAAAEAMKPYYENLEKLTNI